MILSYYIVIYDIIVSIFIEINFIKLSGFFVAAITYLTSLTNTSLKKLEKH